MIQRTNIKEEKQETKTKNQSTWMQKDVRYNNAKLQRQAN